MKLIYPTRISSVSADEADANFPAANVLDDHPKKVWKATSADTKLTCEVSGSEEGIGALAVFNTNAESITVTISGLFQYDWEAGGSYDYDWEAGGSYNYDWDSPTDISVTEIFEIGSDGDSVLWVDYSSKIYVNHEVELLFERTDATIIYAGVVVAGDLYTFERDPQFGVQEGLRDYSIIKELSNGATYVRKRDIARDFGFKINLVRATEFYQLLLDIARETGQQPIACNIAHKGNDPKWVVYGRITVKGSHDFPLNNLVDVKVLEVL